MLRAGIPPGRLEVIGSSKYEFHGQIVPALLPERRRNIASGLAIIGKAWVSESRVFELSSPTGLTFSDSPGCL
jgi:hypothetical protein